MSNTSNHGGSRPGAGRKPNSTKSLNIAELLYSGRKQLTEALPQLFDALQSLAEGATTTHERWVAAGTLTTGSGDNKEPMFPQLAPNELVLVSRDTYTHKPDHKALLAIIQPFLDNIPHLPEHFPQTNEPEPEPEEDEQPQPTLQPINEPKPEEEPKLSSSPDSSSPFVENSPLLEPSASPRLCGSSPNPQPQQKRNESQVRYRTQEEVDAERATTPPLDDDLLYTIEHYTIPRTW